MNPNPLKCEVMFVTPPKRPIIFPTSMLHENNLPIVQKCKLLGVFINSSLNWDDHVSHIITKSNRCMFILYRARQFGFNEETMITLYSWFIRTSLEYAAPVWHPSLTQKQHSQIERVQKRCFRIILGRNYIDYENALSCLNTVSLYERREELTLRFGKSLAKSDKHELLPQRLLEFHSRDTRRGKQLFQFIRCRTARYQNSNMPYIVRKLNAT